MDTGQPAVSALINKSITISKMKQQFLDAAQKVRQARGSKLEDAPVHEHTAHLIESMGILEDSIDKLTLSTEKWNHVIARLTSRLIILTIILVALGFIAINYNNLSTLGLLFSGVLAVVAFSSMFV